MASEIPIIPGLFTPQTVFAINNQPMIMGVLKKGDLALTMSTNIDGVSYKLTGILVSNQHLKSVKSDGKEMTVGITLSDMSTEIAQTIVNQELLFK